MKVGVAIRESLAYVGGVILSCGPSQVFGIVKGAVDLVKMGRVRSVLHRLDYLQAEIGRAQREPVSPERVARLFPQLGAILKEDASTDLTPHIEAIRERNLASLAVLNRSLLADAAALVPGAGALLSWRVHSGYWGPKATKGIKHGVEQMLQHQNDSLTRVFYALSGKTYAEMAREWGNAGEPGDFEGLLNRQARIEGSCCNAATSVVKIAVGFAGSPYRELNAQYWIAPGRNASDTTIVLFHGNAQVGQQLTELARWYVERGVNVLMPTMGGYPGSPGVATSEGSTYQDVEAIKAFLEGKGVKEVGYHGYSIGGSLAMQAAAGNTNHPIRTLFVVADKTFTTARAVAGRIAGNMTSGTQSMAKGVGLAALPRGEPVRLNKGLVVVTDGLDNLAKAKRLQQLNIPLVTIGAADDALMGVPGNDQNNFSRDLHNARYPEGMPSSEGAVGFMDDISYHLMTEGGHTSSIITSKREASSFQFRLIIEDLLEKDVVAKKDTSVDTESSASLEE